ncbi:protein yellow-like [Cloeon dipterum]|uniref:protein yellow-like n=1 Tax=Cloeon dipterum TaxID=197152 RepID=UPI00321FE742
MSPLFSAIFLLGLCLANAFNFTTVYEWAQFDFIWPSGADSSNGQNKQNFKSSKVYLDYMAVFGERLFLSLETQPGIDATLVWLPTSGTSAVPAKLAPFPSWHLHKKNNCDSIQWAKGMETDTDGRLWVLDDGSKKCQGKIWIFDLLNNDKTEHVHQFPDSVVSHISYKRDLRDIVIDQTPDDSLAYILDLSFEHEHIVVYSRKLDKSWLVKTTGRKWYCLALSANREARQLYLARYGSNELYSVSVSELKNEGGSAAVKFIGEWNGKPYRMLIDSANVMYAVFTEQSYVSKWNISEPFLEQRFYEVGELGVEYPFTFSLDTNGNLWMTERNETIINVKRHKLLEAAVSASTALTTPQAQGTTSVTTSSRIPVSETIIPTEYPAQIFTTASSRQDSSAPPLATLSTTHVNGETTEVVKSLETPTGKTGTPRKDLNSNESSGGYAGLAEDYRKSQSLVTILVSLLVCCLVLSVIVIAWLTLRLRRMQISARQTPTDHEREMYVFHGQQGL